MDITPEHRRHLDDLMNGRRLDLGMTWSEVAAAAGVTNETIRALRSGPGGVSELTARKLDRALQWRPGSVAAVIDGEAGTPPPAQGQAPSPQAIPAPPRGLPPLVERNWADPDVRTFWELSVTEAQRLAFIRKLLKIKGDDGGSGTIPAGGKP